MFIETVSPKNLLAPAERDLSLADRTLRSYGAPAQFRQPGYKHLATPWPGAVHHLLREL